MEVKPRLMIDFDGTLAEDKWPEMGELNHGAQEAMVELSKCAELYVYTSRIAPFYMDEVTEKNYELEIRKLRQYLDTRGLGFMKIWDKPWKPMGVAYVDDKAVRYSGRKNAWKYLVPQLQARCEVAITDEMLGVEEAPDI